MISFIHSFLLFTLLYIFVSTGSVEELIFSLTVFVQETSIYEWDKSERIHYVTGGMGYVCQASILWTRVISEVVD